MSRRLYPLADIVFDNLVSLVCNEVERVAEDDFGTRREYLGYVAELSEMLEELRKAKA